MPMAAQIQCLIHFLKIASRETLERQEQMILISQHRQPFYLFIFVLDERTKALSAFPFEYKFVSPVIIVV